MGYDGEKMVLAMCSDRNMGSGITIWDVKTGQTLLHIPTCASPPYGLICLRNEFLVASQTRKEGSVGGGSIFIWSLNKPQPPIMSYTLEPIGPLASTKDSVYLAGGTHSGNIHLWEVGSGKLLKIWSGQRKPIKCVLFSWDDSFLITGSADGMICVWSMIGLLDVELVGNSQPILYCLMEHNSSLTGLLTMSGCSMSIIISSSLNGSLKFWDLMSGMIRGTQAHTEGITAIVLHPTEQLLFSGTADGRIFASRLAFGLDNCITIKENQLLAPKGHKGAITALAFSQMDLISASEDCTICKWDISGQRIIQKLDHKKGRITNLLAVPRSSLISTSNRKRVLNQFSMSSLDKYPQPANLLKSTIPLFPSLQPLRENLNSIGFTSTGSLNQQILDTKTEGTSAAIQMKVETSLERRVWASKMTKQVMDMNNHLQSRLLDMMRIRLFGPTKISSSSKKRKDERDRVARTREKRPLSFH
ncbi:protein ROOT INITIATION DEFECTIVE 3-like isoform X1 [Benincasa hispida]|uniref:protein ROOT INITIATION DEFECTIVE 3-like isoform X1 n=1 Tax=Benincasa hispida TaxID=102211 RepID=UPI001900F2F8|nr:protein ROOT INITIATION DEFECTIVE 3-like isoform X1 [Benincasa hispida]